MKSEYLGFLCTLRFTLTLGAGDHPYEWGGIFETPESNYMWTSQKVNAQYADPSLTMVAWPVTTFTEEALHALEEQAEAAMNMTCTDVQAGGTIVPASNTCFRLVFQETAWQSLYNIDASSAAGIAFFTNHVPTEFEATAHYLKDDHGDDIEPKAEIPAAAAAATEETDWGPPMLGALTVNLATFIGVFLLFPPVRKLSAKPLFGAMLFAFAAGALLACAFFLLLFEATHLVAVGWTAEVDVLWRWGTMILAGLVLPPVVETICSIIMLAFKGGSAAPSGEEASAEAGKTETEDPVAKFRATARLVGAVVIGDFFHNLCDGFFIGAAFKGCGNAFGWSVIAGTILHELPQEVADFVILTGPDVALGIGKALAANFISGTSVLIGAAIVLSAQVDDATIGLILAFGGGVYLHLGATDCLPKLYDPKLGFGQRLAAFAAFVLGAILIGLILIGHEHCVPEGSEGHGGGHGDAHGGGH